MIRRPPRSTLFPTRRSSDLFPAGGIHRKELNSLFPASVNGWRSEEHTSELQSRSDLVCRLLLEKKKRKQLMDFLLANRLKFICTMADMLQKLVCRKRGLAGR